MNKLTLLVVALSLGALSGCGAAPPPVARTAACDRAAPALDELAQTAFFLQHFRTGGDAYRGHADLVDARAARIGGAPADQEASRVLDGVRQAAGIMSTKLRAAAETDSEQGHQAVRQSADGLRAALDQAGEVCGRTFSPFPPQQQH